MEITKLNPNGFCKGVISAIHKINLELQNPNIKQPIYMLGNIVHNKNIVKAFENKGVIILDGNSRLQMLEEINEGTVIFTAHGVSDEIKEIAKRKGLAIIDATCIDVTKTHDVIKNKLQENYLILYYGKENHPEAEGALGLSKDIILVNENTDPSQLPKYDGKIALTNQTTMSYLDVIKLYDKLIEVYPQLELIDEICSATRRRQEAVIKAKEFDLIIVVGDKLSNNTRMLKEIAENKTKVKAIQVETIHDLKDINLNIYKKIAITAGASTPNKIVEEIIYNLENKTNNFISQLSLDDYLKY